MNESWRGPPFSEGLTYRVKRDFLSLRDSFRKGELLRYRNSTYSAYHGYTGYLFEVQGGTELRVWDVHDDDPIDGWQDLFEAAPPAGSPGAG